MKKRFWNWLCRQVWNSDFADVAEAKDVSCAFSLVGISAWIGYIVVLYKAGEWLGETIVKAWEWIQEKKWMKKNGIGKAVVDAEIKEEIPEHRFKEVFGNKIYY